MSAPVLKGRKLAAYTASPQQSHATTGQPTPATFSPVRMHYSPTQMMHLRDMDHTKYLTDNVRGFVLMLWPEA
jgi:hypothetical protein